MEESQRPRRAATHLLERLGARWDGERPLRIDVDQLAREIGLDVETFHPATRRTGTLGWLEPGERLIFLRDGLSEAARRFTLAHEIGHFLLHRSGQSDTDAYDTDPTESDSEECDIGDLDAPADQLSLSSETLRPGQAYSARARRESEANQFASYVLLPAPSLLGSYRRLITDSLQANSPANLRSLADQCGVSEDALLRRLAALLVQAPLELADEPGEDVKVTQQGGPTLDEDQLAAARSATPALVIAGPGTGKTSTLVGRVAYLVRDMGVAADSVLALTFSNKAAGEMRERIQALLAPTNQGDGDFLSPQRLPAISTIHAFCGDLLRRYAPLIGLRPDYRLVTDAEGYFLLREVAGALELPHYLPLAAPAQHFPALLSAISRAKDELCAPDEYAAAAATMATRATTSEEAEAAQKALEVARAYAAYQEMLHSRGDADFGDLIMLTVRLLKEYPDVLDQLREAHQHILVDEFQDINRAIGILLRILAGPDGPLWAVGDADQAIYRFRGASPANLSQFSTEYPNATIHTLRRNYRSLEPVLESAAGLANVFLDGGERVALTAVRGGENERAVTLATATTEDAEIAGLVEAIRRRKEAGRRFSDQVVLCRTRRHCQRIAAALSESGIPALLSAPLFEQDDTKDLLAVAALLADSSGAGLLRARRTPSHAFSQQDAETLLREARSRSASIPTLLAGSLESIDDLSPEGRCGLARLGQALAELRRAPDVATGLARYVFGQTSAGLTLLTTSGLDEVERRESATRIAQVLAFARTFDDQRRALAAARAGADWTGFLDFLRVVAALRQESGAGAGELTLEDGVRVMTVHASKGLEFPVVYLPGLADRRFPMQRQWEPAPLPPPLRERIGLGDPREVHLAEEACLFYVALTRARDELALSHAERYGQMRYQPSPFLAPIRDALGSKLRVAKWSLPHLAGSPASDSRTESIKGARLDSRGEPEAGEQSLTISALETYARCPKQYAYRYIHGLRPREVGLSTLRRSLHATLYGLHERLMGAPAAHDAPSLEEALALFDSAWQGAVSGEWSQTNADSIAEDDAPPASAPATGEAVASTTRDGPFDDVYRRHGRDIVARVWSSLATPSNSDHSTDDVGGREPRAAFDQTVLVRVRDRNIAVNLDRVDELSSRAPARAATRQVARSTQQTGEPARVVRHKLGLSQDRGPDLRALLYRLAAEQAPGGRANLYQQNLTTGEVQPMEIDQRRLAKLYDDLDELITGIERGEFAPRPTPNNCNSCPFLFICPT